MLDTVVYFMYYYKYVESTAGLTNLRVNSAVQLLSRRFCPMIEKYQEKVTSVSPVIQYLVA